MRYLMKIPLISDISLKKKTIPFISMIFSTLWHTMAPLESLRSDFMAEELINYVESNVGGLPGLSGVRKGP